MKLKLIKNDSQHTLGEPINGRSNNVEKYETLLDGKYKNILCRKVVITINYKERNTLEGYQDESERDKKFCQIIYAVRFNILEKFRKLQM